MPDDRVTFIAATQCVVIRGERFLVIVRAEASRTPPERWSFPGERSRLRTVLTTFSNLPFAVKFWKKRVSPFPPKLEYVRSLFYALHDGSPVVDTLFLGEYAEGEPHITDTCEVAEVKWMKAEEILAHDKTPSWNKPDVLRVEALRRRQTHPRPR